MIASAGEAVATCAAYFLIIALDVSGDVVVHNPAYIAFVNAHSKGNGGANHLCLAVYKRFLSLFSLLGR